jgi:hypothetical protein
MIAPTIISEWAKNARETIRVSLDSFNGSPIICVRTFCRADDGELRPGRQGMALGIKHLPALSEAIDKALAEAKARGLVDGGQS